jgi:Smr domain
MLEMAMKSFHMLENQETTNANSGVSFASTTSKGYSGALFTPDDSTKNSMTLSGSTPSKSVKIPQDLWNAHINRDSQVFHIPDPMERYAFVSASVKRSDVIDLHYQSTKTFAVVLANVLPEKLRDHGQVWVVTGTGHHVGRSTHQKGGGALESAVLSWLSSEGYDFCRGRDRNGHGGAVLVKAL